MSQSCGINQMEGSKMKLVAPVRLESLIFKVAACAETSPPPHTHTGVTGSSVSLLLMSVIKSEENESSYRRQPLFHQGVAQDGCPREAALSLETAISQGRRKAPVDKWVSQVTQSQNHRGVSGGCCWAAVLAFPVCAWSVHPALS